jgi:hypothetical protein
MRTPVHAMLWETWRVTRVEAIWKLALGLIGGLLAFAVKSAFASPENLTRLEDFSAVFALVLLVGVHVVGWISPPRLNDSKPGFPFRLLYTRPVRTSVLVGVPLAYLTVLPAATYLVSALSLRFIFGYPFPLLSVAASIAILNLVLAANYWSARRMIFLILGAVVAAVAWIDLARFRLLVDGLEWRRAPKLTWPTIFDMSLSEYALLALVGLAAFGVVVARVARQRHGDARTPVPAFWNPGAGYPERFVNLFRFACPTSSAKRAQLWFDLKSTGLPALMIGIACAILIPLVISLAVFFHGAVGVDARPLAALLTVVTPSLVLMLGGNAFGVRQKQGRAYVSAFETTQPYETAQLAAHKILVRSACVLAALITIGASILISLSFFAKDRFADIEAVVAVLSWYDQLALAFVAMIGVVFWVAVSAVLAALRMRYSHVLNFAVLLLVLFVIPLTMLTMGKDLQEAGSLGQLLRATSCAAAVPMVFLTLYLFWSGFAERLLTLRYVCGAVALSAAFGAAWVAVLHAAGVQFAGMSAMHIVPMLLPVLLLFTVTVFAPSALDSIRSPVGWPTSFRGKEPAKNDLELTLALMTAPSSAFAELRNRPRSWFPLLLVVLTSAGLVYWYYSTVDLEWLKDTVLSKAPNVQKLTEAERAARMSRVDRNDLLLSHVIGTLVFIPLFSVLQAWYFLLAAKVTKLPHSFNHWLALTCWCALPALLGRIASAILILQADTTQLAMSLQNPLSLNALLFHVGRGAPGYELLEVLSIPFILSWALTLIGVRAWSQRSWAYSATMFLLPSVVTYGIWVFILSQ